MGKMLMKRGLIVCCLALMLAFAAGCGEKKDEGNPVINGVIAEYEKVVTLLESKKPTEINKEEMQTALMKMAEGAKKIEAEKLQPNEAQKQKIKELTERLQKIAKEYQAEQQAKQVDAFISEYEKVISLLENQDVDEINQDELQGALAKMTQTASALKARNIEPTEEQKEKIESLTGRLQNLLQQRNAKAIESAQPAQ